MSMTFDQEYKELTDLINFKEYRRYGNDLFAKYVFDGGYEWKYEYNICEFVWGFVKNPCFAPRLVRYLEKNVTDMKKYLKILAKSNKQVNNSNLFGKWESAMNAAEGSKNPCIIYSTENSHVMMGRDNQMFCNDVDGDLWHGLLMTENLVNSLHYIKFEVSGVSSENNEWTMEYMFDQIEIQKKARYFDSEQQGLLFYSPFKHPLILFNSNLECTVTLVGEDVTENQIKLVYGICGKGLRNFLQNPTNTFTTELCNNSRLIVDTSNGVVDEESY
jgi:hypothetical protein